MHTNTCKNNKFIFYKNITIWSCWCFAESIGCKTGRPFYNHKACSAVVKQEDTVLKWGGLWNGLVHWVTDWHTDLLYILYNIWTTTHHQHYYYWLEGVEDHVPRSCHCPPDGILREQFWYITRFIRCQFLIFNPLKSSGSLLWGHPTTRQAVSFVRQWLDTKRRQLVTPPLIVLL